MMTLRFSVSIVWYTYERFCRRRWIRFHESDTELHWTLPNEEKVRWDSEVKVIWIYKRRRIKRERSRNNGNEKRSKEDEAEEERREWREEKIEKREEEERREEKEKEEEGKRKRKKTRRTVPLIFLSCWWFLSYIDRFRDIESQSWPTRQTSTQIRKYIFFHRRSLISQNGCIIGDRSFDETIHSKNF